MTFRDTSANTTLDGANMGDFEKWANSQGIGWTMRTSAEVGWDARQPEIDALKAEISGADSVNRVVIAEIERLKAENERLRADAERLNGLRALCGYTQDGSQEYVSIYQDDATHTFVLRIGKTAYEGPSFTQVLDAAMKDFSTTTKEEECDS